MARRKGDDLLQTFIVKRYEEEELVMLQCSRTAFDRMKLINLPESVITGQVKDGQLQWIKGRQQPGADSERYRVLWPGPPGAQAGKLPTTSFILGPNHCSETLYVLADFMREQGVEFIKLGNKSGNCLRDLRLFGRY